MGETTMDHTVWGTTLYEAFDQRPTAPDPPVFTTALLQFICACAPCAVAVSKGTTWEAIEKRRNGAVFSAKGVLGCVYPLVI
jgi:hypothetical protein